MTTTLIFTVDELERMINGYPVEFVIDICGKKHKFEAVMEDLNNEIKLANEDGD